MANIKLVGALIVVIAIDMFIFLGQTAMSEIASMDPTYDGNTFYHGNSTWIGNSGSDNRVDTSAISLPEQSPVEASDGSVSYTDSISVSKSWFISAGDYFVRVTGGPVNYVQALNLPAVFSFAIGAFWYTLSMFLVVAFIMGRE